VLSPHLLDETALPLSRLAAKPAVWLFLAAAGTPPIPPSAKSMSGTPAANPPTRRAMQAAPSAYPAALLAPICFESGADLRTYNCPSAAPSAGDDDLHPSLQRHIRLRQSTRCLADLRLRSDAK